MYLNKVHGEPPLKKDDVCENSIGNVYVSGYCGLSGSGPCVFGKLFKKEKKFVGLLYHVVMSYVCCVLNAVLISGDDVCCSVVFGTLV